MIRRLFAIPPPPPRDVRMPRMTRGARDLVILRMREASLEPYEIAAALDVLPSTIYGALSRARKAREAARTPEETP